MKGLTGLRTLFVVCSVLGIGSLYSCNNENEKATANSVGKVVEIKNPLNFELSDQLVELDLKELGIQDSLTDFPYRLSSSDSICRYEVVDTNGDNLLDKVLLMCNLAPSEKIRVSFVPENEKSKIPDPLCTEKLTQADLAIKTNGEWVKKKAVTGKTQYVYVGGNFKNIHSLDVPGQHTDHSMYIKYEGVGWESEKIGYRLYLDWRNAIDVFGKTKNEIVLRKVGLDGFESYHYMEDWGMDVLKVGPSLGIGTLGFWDKSKAVRVEKVDSVKCCIALNGHLKSIVEADYFGWKVDSVSVHLNSKLSIYAGSRLTQYDIVLDKELNNLCTGIAKHQGGSVIQTNKHSNAGWSFFATYGPQSLNNDNLGLFILYNTRNIVEIVEDAYNYVLVLKPDNKKLIYYFGAAWSLEENGIKSNDEFVRYLNKQLDILNNPVELKLY